MFNTSPTAVPSAPKPPAEPYRFYSSFKSHPFYFLFLVVIGYLMLFVPPFPADNDFLNFFVEGYGRGNVKALIIIGSLSIIFSNLWKSVKRACLIVIVLSLYGDGIIFGSLVAPFFILFAITHYLILEGLIYASDRKKHSKLVLIIYSFLLLVVLGLIWIDNS